MAETPVKLEIKCDTIELTAALSELNLYAEWLPSDTRERLVQFLTGGCNLLTDMAYKNPADASDVQTQVVFFKPAQRFLDLLNACRSGNLDSFLEETNK